MVFRTCSNLGHTCEHVSRSTAGRLMPGLDDPSVINVVAGGIAGAATAVFVCPLDVLKTRMQVQSVKAGDLRYSLRGKLIT